MALACAVAPQGAAGQDADEAVRIDYLTFAQGAVPVAVGGAAADLGLAFEQAVRAIDGAPGGFGLTRKPGAEDMDAELTYQLPAATTFDRFAVPNVLETPSPSATFARDVEVLGSSEGPDNGFVVLASGVLSTHESRGQVTELELLAQSPVRWVKVRLRGGIQVLRPETFFEFSEIIGNGSQEPLPLATGFSGVWKGRGVLIELQQDGPVVSGCYDREGRLTGTVSGSILRALGAAGANQIQSAFILSVAENGDMLGVRSTNGAPFALYTGERGDAGAASVCPTPPPVALGCGSVIHGINFDFDSATLRPDSDAVLARLFDGLREDPSEAILIEGHTSSEGAEAYNLSLSERRAQAVVDELVGRGIESSRLSAVGVGEGNPIATNDDESGRSLNRRVAVRCQ